MHTLWAAKLTTASVIGVAVTIALTGAESVFALVLDAWGLLGSAFAPLVLLQAFGKRIPQSVSITMIIVGVAVFLLWQQMGWGAAVYSVAPGIISGFIVYTLLKVAQPSREAEYP
jgi:Na+(H+)/acetate symporter ActP